MVKFDKALIRKYVRVGLDQYSDAHSNNVVPPELPS